MEIQSAFDLVADKVEKALAEQDYKRQNVDSQNDKEITALYTSEDTAYNIVYYKAKMRMVLRQCEMSVLSLIITGNLLQLGFLTQKLILKRKLII